MADPALNALYRKRIALTDVQIALMAKRTNTAADAHLNEVLELIDQEIEDIDGLVDATDPPQLAPPTTAEAAGLQQAIASVENSIAQNDSVNNLMNAANVLIGTFQRKA